MGVQVRAATARGLVLVSPQAVPSGAVLECEVLLGARPLPVMARVVSCRSGEGPGKHLVEVEFLAMAQVDRDSLTDFLSAVGASALRVRERRDE
jgi:hypothetical protein